MISKEELETFLQLKAQQAHDKGVDGWAKIKKGTEGQGVEDEGERSRLRVLGNWDRAESSGMGDLLNDIARKFGLKIRE